MTPIRPVFAGMERKNHYDHSLINEFNATSYDYDGKLWMPIHWTTQGGTDQGESNYLNTRFSFAEIRDALYTSLAMVVTKTEMG